MIGYDEALQRLLANARPLTAQACAPAEALGRVLAADVISPLALPSFDHAAMDGYALDARSTLTAGSEHDVGGSQAAGDSSRGSAGTAWEIMTGAQLPEGLDAVVPVEFTQLLRRHEDGSPARIRLSESLASGANVRYAGSDVPQGAMAVPAGVCVDPSHIMLLAALGVASVDVVRQPAVAIICTGKELVSDPQQPLGDGQIYSSNGPYLVAAFRAMGATVVSCEAVDDTAVTYEAAVSRARDAGVDIIVSTGAVSMGRYDFVPETLDRLGARLLFHKVAIRPGKPLLAAQFDNGPLVFALPGTPMAVAVGLRFFVAPVFRAMLGQGAERPMCAVLDAACEVKTGLRHFLRASLSLDDDGRLRAAITPQPQPFRIAPFARAHAWVVLPEDAGTCPAGRVVQVASLHPCPTPWPEATAMKEH